MTPGQLIAALRAEGHLALADHPLEVPGEMDAPWYVRLIQGVGGWLAALFLLFALGLLFNRLLESLPGSLVVAALGIGGAWALSRRGAVGDFRGQLALACYLTGLGALAFACHNLLRQDRPAAALFGLLALTFAWFMPLRLQRLAGALIALFAFAFAAGRDGNAAMLAALSLATVVLWLGEWQWTAAGLAERLAPWARAAALVLLALPVQDEPWRPLAHQPGWLVAVGMAPALIAAALLLGRGQPWAARLAALAAAAGGALLAAWAPGVPVALLVALLAYGAGSRALLGFALLAGAAYLGQFYYQMQITLLEKSAALLAAGLALLALRWLLQRLDRQPRHG